MSMVMEICISTALIVEIFNLFSSFFRETVSITSYRMSIFVSIIWIVIAMLNV